MKRILLMALVLGNSLYVNPQSQKNEKKVITKNSIPMNMTYKTIKVNGLDIFYRESGSITNPTILFLHGFPSSSHMYRDIMVDLSQKYHVIAPDYPGFGYSSTPSLIDFDYTFDNLSHIIDGFIDVMHLKKVNLYLQDYGGPVGFRVAARRPELIQSLLIQNANAYNEGLGDAVAPLVNYFKKQTPETEKGAREILTTTQWQYTDGVADLSKVSPDSYIHDDARLSRKGNDLIQLSFFRSYGSNIALYDSWHEYFKKYQPATLVVWGKNDKIFISPGALAYKNDINDAEVHLLDGGHFLLEEHHAEVATLIDTFLTKSIKK